jgi:hypothetical protein
MSHRALNGGHAAVFARLIAVDVARFAHPTFEIQ